MKITNIYNQEETVKCLSCDLVNRKIPVPGGSIFESKYFDAQQDFEIPIPGFVIVVSKRHIKSIDEFNEEESADFMSFMVKIRKAMRNVLGIECVYLIQEEDTEHHFHVWIFPITQDFREKYGKGIENVRPYMEYARAELKTKENLEIVESATRKLREYLSK